MGRNRSGSGAPKMTREQAWAAIVKTITDEGALTISDIAEIIGWSYDTAYHRVNEAVEEGYLEQQGNLSQAALWGLAPRVTVGVVEAAPVLPDKRTGPRKAKDVRPPLGYVMEESNHAYQDITGPLLGVEVDVQADGKALWVHIDGVTVLRVRKIPHLDVIDNRPGRK